MQTLEKGWPLLGTFLVEKFWLSMACALNACLIGSWSGESLNNNGSLGIFPSINSKEFLGKSIQVSDLKGLSNWSAKLPPTHVPVRAQASICVSKAMRWWEKTLKPNMIEINSAQQLVDSLSNAGDRLVIVNFYSPGCGGCKALHPKICQLAESNPDSIFLKVNYEELKTMCYALHIHVLPFFRFYRGAEGRVCSFSCTNATIKKFKDALGKYGTERCSLGPAKGLEESELFSLASIGQVSLDFPLQYQEDIVEDLVLNLGKSSNNMSLKEENRMVIA